MFSYGYGGPQMIQAASASDSKSGRGGSSMYNVNNAFDPAADARAVAKLKGDLDEFKAATSMRGSKNGTKER